ncbi:DUF3052 family protein [Sphingosinicella sp. BN140058]|nr:DUF3052 family protein [Sphingosinicella sp. BN140058]
MPDSVRAEIEAAGLELHLLEAPAHGVEAAHLFVTCRAMLEEKVAQLRPLLAPAGFLWVSWPKKSAGLASDVTEDVIRAVALPTGLVDVKVCAVDPVWSGLKLMIRKSER